MPQYIIRCHTTHSYHLVVEAPNKEAVENYYEVWDETDVSFTSGDEHSWRLAEIVEWDPRNTPLPVDVMVNDEGEAIEEGES